MSISTAQMPIAAEIRRAVPGIHSAGHENAAGDESSAGCYQVLKIVIGAVVKGVTQDADVRADIGYTVDGLGRAGTLI